VLEFLYHYEVGMKDLSEVPVPLAHEKKQRSGAYQSRIFTFFQRQTDRLRNGFDQSWRQVRFSVKMTGQLLLFPLRLLTRWQTNKNSQIPSKNAPPLAPVVEKQSVALAKPLNMRVDRLLAELSAAGYGRLVTTTATSITPTYEDWSSIDEQEWNVTLLDQAQRPLTTTATTNTPELSVQPIIRGLASRRRDRHLVLVDDHNQVLDVLSPSQQLRILRKIDPQATPPSPLESAGERAELTDRDPQSIKILSPGSFDRQEQRIGDDRAVPKTPWQKLHHWFEFYREYLRVEFEEMDSAEREANPDIAPGKLVKNSLNSATGAMENLIPTSRKIAPSFGTESQTIPAFAPDNANQDKVFTPEPEWIEAPSRLVGYERSWLVRFLEWLDGLMLAIENFIVSCYHRLFDHLS
jgi:hypothetical protein